jgi:DNA-directed RNA polymerase subunit RPC12/RpoP
MVVPENADEKEYAYQCSACKTQRLVKGKQPGPGWDCADGGYACKRRYNCTVCNRSLYKEGDPSDKYECKDVGRPPCQPSKKQKK